MQRPTALFRPLVAALAAIGLSAAPCAAQAQSPERRVAIIYTGFTGGLSSGSVTFSELLPLFKGPLPEAVRAGALTPDNAFRHGEFVIYTDQGPLTLEDFQAFFAAGPYELADEGAVPYLRSDYVFALHHAAQPWAVAWLGRALQADGGFPDARVASGRRYRITNRQGLTLSLLSLEGQAPPMGLLESPSRWELLPASAVRLQEGKTRTPLLAFGRPLGDGLRRAQLMAELERQYGEHALVVDAGNLLDPGFSELSIANRAFTFLQLGRLGYHMVVPAETELGLEQADWEQLAKQVPLVAANLAPRGSDRAALPPYVIKTVDGVRLALVGLVDDRTATLTGAAGPKSPWKVSDPLAVAREMIREAGAKADAVVLVTNVRDERLHELRLLPGAIAVVGEFLGLPGETYEESVQLSGIERRRSMTPYLVARSSRSRVGVLETRFNAPEGQPPSVLRMDGHAHLVTDRLPQDEAWRWQLNVTQGRYQASRRELLLPDVRDLKLSAEASASEALTTLDAPRWNRLVANVAREATGAEVAVIRRLPQSSWAVGPLSQLTLESWLELGDRVVQTTLPGKALKALAAADEGAQLLAYSGFDPTTKKVLGAALIDEELYRVTTTDQVVRHALYEAQFAKRPLTERWLRLPSGLVSPYELGDRPMLREVAIGFLRGLKAGYAGAFGPEYLERYRALLADQSATLLPRWTVALEDGQLLLNTYQANNNQAFSQVRNTRVTSPSSFAFGGKGRLATVYDAKPYAWENRLKAIYRRATLRNKEGVEITQETDDEVSMTTEFRLKGLPLPGGPQERSLMPFVNGNYITQFTPDEANGVTKPRRADLSAAGGLVLYPGGMIKELRAGAVLKNDLANPGYLEPGFQAVGLIEQALPLAVPATLKAGFDITHYLNTPTDTPDRLGLLADLTAAVTIPLWDRFNFSVSADYFLFRGKVPETSSFGSSLDFKVGIGYSLAFKPFYGVWF